MNGGVICGVDDSAAAVDAALVAHQLAELLDLPLHVVHVAADPESGEAMRPVLERIADSASQAVELGHPADRLVELAAEQEAALLVLGCHGLRSSLLGSISADVSRRASCPVVVVPPGARMHGVGAVQSAPFAGGIARFGLG
jgi:nucleotide-binding universal stress UspA family protein